MDKIPFPFRNAIEHLACDVINNEENLANTDEVADMAYVNSELALAILEETEV